MEFLDIKDKKILIELDTNARQPLKQIAKKVKLSKEVVAYRIKNLEKKGIISNYITLSHFAKTGSIHFKLYIKYSHASEKVKKEIVNYLLSFNNLGWLASTEGIFDLMLSIRFQDIFQFEDFKDKFFKRYDNYFHTTEFAILTEAETKPRYYIYQPKNKRTLFLHCDKSKQEKLDKIDKKVLTSLRLNARTPLIDLKKKTNISTRIIQYRRKHLEERGIIVGYKIAIGYQTLGYLFFKCLITFNKMTEIRYNQLREYVRNHPNIIYWIKTIGPWDLELEIEAHSLNEFHKITKDLKDRFADITLTFDTTLVAEEHLITHA